MNKKFLPSRLISGKTLTIVSSKSETNRLLMIEALYDSISVENPSLSEDSRIMSHGLHTTGDYIDVHHAGTAMRFLTAYFSIQEDRSVLLSGSERMKQRPIGVLVDALRQLGADIEYVERKGYPPLKIKGKKLNGGEVMIDPSVSSQYVTALLLIGAKLNEGLKLIWKDELTSVPYVLMTLTILNKAGIQTRLTQNGIWVLPVQSFLKTKYIVESDWSSASYYFSLIALSDEGTEIILKNFYEDTTQGDKILMDYYERLGVESELQGGELHLRKKSIPSVSLFEANLKDSPDIAQTLAVTCVGLGIGCKLTGLHTLKIKETDRLVALQNEITRLGVNVKTSDDTLESEAGGQLREDVVIRTYQDHRMAMAFTPLALKTTLSIENPDVVVKSYPDFWEHMEQIGLISV